MNPKNTNLLIIITIFLSIYAAFQYFIQKANFLDITVDLQSNIALEKNKAFNARDSYLQWLKEEERTIWHELEATIQLTQQECQEKTEKRSAEYKSQALALQTQSSSQNLSEDNLQLIATVLKDFNVPEKSILISLFEDFCPAAANDCVLLINESLFNKLTPAAKKFCIGHELQHFIHHDTSTFEIILKHCNTRTKTDFSEIHPVNKLSRFNELRADLVAALKSDDYTQGYKEFIDFTISRNGEGLGITHPKNALRLSYAQDIMAKKA